MRQSTGEELTEAEALLALHARGIAHRDIKPHNVRLRSPHPSLERLRALPPLREDTPHPQVLLADDGSCRLAGCTDPSAANYLPSATKDNGNCYHPGCTDSRDPKHYNPHANVNDGSCDLPVFGCTNPTAPNYFSKAQSDDGSCIVLGCTDRKAPNFNAKATNDDGSCLPPKPMTSRTGGCTDSFSSNYSPTASFDDGTCIRYIPGCSDPLAANYRSVGSVKESSAATHTNG